VYSLSKRPKAFQHLFYDSKVYLTFFSLQNSLTFSLFFLYYKAFRFLTVNELFVSQSSSQNAVTFFNSEFFTFCCNTGSDPVLSPLEKRPFGYCLLFSVLSFWERKGTTAYFTPPNFLRSFFEKKNLSFFQTESHLFALSCVDFHFLSALKRICFSKRAQRYAHV
jgi:hypothetical protein